MRYSVYYTKTSILIKLAIAAIDTFISFAFLSAKAILVVIQYKNCEGNSNPHPPDDDEVKKTIVRIIYKSFGFTIQF